MKHELQYSSLGFSLCRYPSGRGRASLHNVTQAIDDTSPIGSCLTFKAGDMELDVFMPGAVATAMRQAFDKAMAELSKEDAA